MVGVIPQQGDIHEVRRQFYKSVAVFQRRNLLSSYARVDHMRDHRNDLRKLEVDIPAGPVWTAIIPETNCPCRTLLMLWVDLVVLLFSTNPATVHVFFFLHSQHNSTSKGRCAVCEVFVRGRSFKQLAHALEGGHSLLDFSLLRSLRRRYDFWDKEDVSSGARFSQEAGTRARSLASLGPFLDSAALWDNSGRGLRASRWILPKASRWLPVTVCHTQTLRLDFTNFDLTELLMKSPQGEGTSPPTFQDFCGLHHNSKKLPPSRPRWIKRLQFIMDQTTSQG